MNDRAHGKLFHRFPFVLIDRSEAAEPGRSRSSRAVSNDDAMFEGAESETYGRALLIEAMAQAAALFAEEERREHSGFLAGMKHVRLARAPRPGERLTVETRLVQRFGELVRIEGRVTHAGELLADGEILISLAGSRGE
jgi:3-hydroxymyristoyl/3-hydroxydecanoyl-(acyl carrier protein) dehydratase